MYYTITDMRYSIVSKINFYLTLAYYKLISPLECRNYHLRVLINEFAFLFYTLGFAKLNSEHGNKIVLKTKFGDFQIRDIGIDLQIASPAFERLDLEALIRKIHDALARNHTVTFIDVGAGFGKFTVAIGTHFRKYARKLTIYSFEPERENFELLRKNIRLNQLRNVRSMRLALSDKTVKQKFYYFELMRMIVSFPTSQKVFIRTKPLDSLRKYLINGDNTELFIKLDAEEHEIKALQGSKKTISMSKNTTLLIEDSAGATHEKLIRYLASHGSFLVKHTAYNSFWRLAS